MGKGIKAFIILIFVTIAALVLTVCVGVYTNGFESISKYYVKVNGGIVNESEPITISCAAETTIALSGAGFKAADYGNYTVFITANPDAVTVKKGGAQVDISKADVTASFDIGCGKSSITFKAKDYSPQTIMALSFGTSAQVEVDESKAPYSMTIAAENGRALTYALDYATGGAIVVSPEHKQYQILFS